MTSATKNHSGAIRPFLIRFRSSFWLRAAIMGGFFFVGFGGWLAINPPPGSKTIADPIVIPVLGVLSAFYGVTMSWFLGLMMQGQRIRALEAEVARLRRAIDDKA